MQQAVQCTANTRTAVFMTADDLDLWTGGTSLCVCVCTSLFPSFPAEELS